VKVSLKQFYPRRRYVLGGVLGISICAALLATSVLPPQVWHREALVRTAKIVQDWTQPDITWETATPESQGMSSVRLDALRDQLADRDTNAFLVARNGLIVYEWYSPGYGPKTRHYVAGLTQSLAGSLVLMEAVESGLISFDDPAWKYIPQWKDDSVRSRITIRHLATESSGLDNVSFIHASRLTGWKRDYHRSHKARFSISLTQAPIIFPPGTQSRHSGPGQHVLAYALAASLKDVPEQDVYSLLRQRIIEPIEIPEGQWSFNHCHSYYDVNGLKAYSIGGGASYIARAMARIAQLLLNGGNWNGNQLLAPELIDMMTNPAGDIPVTERVLGNPEPESGIGWRVNADRVWPSLPPDAYVGAGDQVVLVVPSLDLIVVRAGGFSWRSA
jgi:CubicO group peptidase (beta-lactamase class C family)